MIITIGQSLLRLPQVELQEGTVREDTRYGQ